MPPRCEKCGFMHYRTDPCRKPEPLSPAPLQVQSAPKPKRSGNRHRPGYFTEYMRKYRAEVKAGIRFPANKREDKNDEAR